MFQVPVRRGSMKEMLKAVRDLEKRGYDYVTPIKKVYRAEKTFYNDGNSKGRTKFASQAWKIVQVMNVG